MSELKALVAGDQGIADRTQARSFRRIAAMAAVGLLTVVVGYMTGLRSPWSAHHPQVVVGTVERVPADLPTGYFSRPGEQHVAFRLDDVVWRDGNRTGSDSVPPCLREAEKLVDAEVGIIEVARPFGSGSYLQVLSLTCLSQ